MDIVECCKLIGFNFDFFPYHSKRYIINFINSSINLVTPIANIQIHKESHVYKWSISQKVADTNTFRSTVSI